MPDGLLIEASLDGLDERVGQAQEWMSEASRQVLGGFALTTDADIYRYPERGIVMKNEEANSGTR